MSADKDVYDERLWMKVANLTGAAGNSTALVGTPEQVAEAMLGYYDIGITTLLFKGFDPLADALDFGDELIPLVREGVKKRDAVIARYRLQGPCESSNNTGNSVGAKCQSGPIVPKISGGTRRAYFEGPCDT